MKPGGYIELAEFGTKLECDDGTLRADDAAKRTVEFLAEAMTAMGRSPVNDTVLQEHLHNTGFVDIQVFPLSNTTIDCRLISRKHR